MLAFKLSSLSRGESQVLELVLNRARDISKGFLDLSWVVIAVSVVHSGNFEKVVVNSA